MRKHLNDALSYQSHQPVSENTPDAEANDAVDAGPEPLNNPPAVAPQAEAAKKSRHGPAKDCSMCDARTTALSDHMAFSHGIETERSKYATRVTHLKRMKTDILILHLIQDGAELNQLWADIQAAEDQLAEADPSYESVHSLELDVVYETNSNHASFRDGSRTLHARLVDRLAELRADGLKKDTLFDGQPESYSEVLNDLNEVLASL